MTTRYGNDDTALPAIRLNDIQFRLELVERTLNRVCDDIENMRNAQASYDEEKQREREAWDGR